MKRLTVLLVFGGESTEHDISVKSAHNVNEAIDSTKYDVKLVFIDRIGRWWLCEKIEDAFSDNLSVQLSVIPGSSQLITSSEGQHIDIDVILPILHGKFGEDGSVQGLAAMAHIPIVGCSIEASAICMNKDAAKRLVAAAGIPVIPGIAIRNGDDIGRAMEAVDALGGEGPWFIKPARSGSSIGVTKVKVASDIAATVSGTFKYDDIVLVETAIEGRELEVAALGNPPNHIVSAVGEVVAGGEFYDYDAKYSNESKSEVILKADLEPGLSDQIIENTRRIYQILGCTGLARLDFRLSNDGTPYLMEVNTIPGFTDISMYPKLWEQEGISYSELVDRLITLALE